MPRNSYRYIEFSGMPKSGKTTISEIVGHSLKRNGYNVREHHGGGKYAPIGKEFLEYLNLWLGNATIQYILEMDTKLDPEPTIQILDRGLFDRCVFTRAIYKKKLIDELTYNKIVDYLTLPILVSKIDIVFLFITSPSLSIERENSNKLIKEPGRVMNSDFLSILRESSLEMKDLIDERFKEIELIDTGELNNNIHDTAEKVNNRIQNLIHQ